MLRYVVGNEQYRKVITEYLKEHPYELVESNDLYRAFYDVLGINLDWFFDEWVYRGGIPKYEVSYKDDSSLFEMSVAQTHAQDATKGLFRMPIPVHVYYTDGSIDSFMIPNESFTTKTFYWEKSGVAKKVSFVLFDPNWNVLKTVVFNKSYEELIAQATSAKNMIDRYDAIIELKNIDIEKKRNDLIKLYNKESFYGLQTEIVSQLANDKNKSSQELLIKATTNKNHLVRRATIEGVIELQKPLQKQYELLLKDSSYVTIEIALNKLCSTYPNNVKKYLELTKNEIGMNKNIRIAWLSNACKYIDKNTYKNELIDYSSHSYEFRTRTKAFNAIENLELFDETIANNLMNAMCSSNARLANPAISVLRKLISSNTDNKVIAKKILETKTWKDWQKEILSKEIN
jgi:aminopeptidase N